MTEYDMHDSGKRQDFDTGARRDLQDGKGRFDLISPVALRRLAVVMEKGAGKYGDRNWELGIPMARCMDSALRHLNDYLEGKRDEDHLGQAMFNVMAMLHTEEMVERGNLPADLANIPSYLSEAKRARDTWQAIFPWYKQKPLPMTLWVDEALIHWPDKATHDLVRQRLGKGGIIPVEDYEGRLYYDTSADCHKAPLSDPARVEEFRQANENETWFHALGVSWESRKAYDEWLAKYHPGSLPVRGNEAPLSDPARGRHHPFPREFAKGHDCEQPADCVCSISAGVEVRDFKCPRRDRRYDVT